jgi:Rps23 Pro-64 3,4-dihydroxylase Tpa1-like proline 4-hydroxylase
MTSIEQSKEKLHKDGYCDFDLKDFNPIYYELFEKIKYKTFDDKYLENFIAMKFNYHNHESNTHIDIRPISETFKESIIKKEEFLKNYDYENILQIWHMTETIPKPTIDEITFYTVFYDILEYFYKETKDEIKIHQQWTCYSEGCFLKNHNDGQGIEYQNTCAILIYLNEEWDESWGGNLVLRNTKNQNDDVVAYKVIPTFGKVAIIDLKTFDTSHAVERVIGNHHRCTLLAFATSRTPIHTALQKLI